MLPISRNYYDYAIKLDIVFNQLCPDAKERLRKAATFVINDETFSITCPVCKYLTTELSSGLFGCMNCDLQFLVTRPSTMLTEHSSGS